MENRRIVLASASPRRKELMNQIGLEPDIVISHIKERVTSSVPSQVVMELAPQKAEDVAKNQEPGTFVIGADTVVAADGIILGKPSDHQEARRMLGMLEGKKHQVYTGVCIIRCGELGRAGEKAIFFDEADVEVAHMSEAEMEEYAGMEEPMDKAGAYGIQGFFARYIKGITGSYANVMGLPVHLVYQELKKLGFWEMENRTGKESQ